MSDHILELSTTASPAKKFRVDQEEFSLLGFEHLSKNDEAKVTAALARYDRISTALELSGNDREAESLATKLREKRLDIITRLTTLPRNIADKLPMSQQTKLMNAVQEEVRLAGEDEVPSDESEASSTE